MALCTDDIKTARLANLVRLGRDFLLKFLVEFLIFFSCRDDFLVVGFSKTGCFLNELFGVAKPSHFCKREILRVTAKLDIGTASRHICGDGDSALFACLSDDFRLTLVIFRIEDFVLDTARLEEL